jgi:polar amino acid transport system ATP-binding protein
MIRIRDIHKTFGRLEVLRGVDLDVDRGEVVVLIGSSGSGKTTFLRCLNFLAEYEAGQIHIGDKLMWYRDPECRKKRPIREIARDRTRIGMVFQAFNLFPHRTVLENIVLGPTRIKAEPLSSDAARSLAMDLLRRVGLEDKASAYPATLSGGQQQRVAIARALAMEPEVMLFDEVTSALDPELVGEVLNVMRQLAREGMTMIVVTHEIPFALDVADRVVFMDGGRVLEQGPPAEILFNPQAPRLREFLRRFEEMRLFTERMGNASAGTDGVPQ